MANAAQDPTYLKKKEFKLKNGALDKDGDLAFKNKAERARVERPDTSQTGHAGTGLTPRDGDGNLPKDKVAKDNKTVDGKDAGLGQDQVLRGVDSFTIDESRAFAQRCRLELDLPMGAGISGSTADLMTCAKMMGLGASALHEYALGVLGYIGGGGNHSYAEIAIVVAASGVSINPDTYDGFAPPSFSKQFEELKKAHPNAFKNAQKKDGDKK